MDIAAKKLISREKENLKYIPKGYQKWRDNYVTNGKSYLKNFGVMEDENILINFAKCIYQNKNLIVCNDRECKRRRVKNEDRIYVVSDNLRILRESAGWTVRDINAFTNISRAYISKYENKKLKADITTIKDLADFFKVDYRTLIEEKVEHNEATR